MSQRVVRSLPIGCLLFLMSCGGNSAPPTSPTPQPPAPPANTLVTGTVVDAVTDQPIAGATIRATGLPDVTAGSGGAFTLTYPGQTTFDVKPTVISSPDTVERTSTVMFPGTGPIRPSLIPKSFDLVAFDLMFRSNGGVLRRFTSAPMLIIERRVLTFTPDNTEAMPASAATITDAEARSIADDMSVGLPQLTGGAFPAFSETRIEISAEGDMVPVVRPGAIVVARATNVGGGTWLYFYNLGDLAVTRSALLLDATVDAAVAVAPRRAMRIHYLGHVLSWEHMDKVPSAMNTTILTEPTEFDRVASRIAFQRMPGNSTPDKDLSGVTLRQVRGEGHRFGSH